MEIFEKVFKFNSFMLRWNVYLIFCCFGKFWNILSYMASMNFKTLHLKMTLRLCCCCCALQEEVFQEEFAGKFNFYKLHWNKNMLALRPMKRKEKTKKHTNANIILRNLSNYRHLYCISQGVGEVEKGGSLSRWKINKQPSHNLIYIIAWKSRQTISRKAKWWNIFWVFLLNPLPPIYHTYPSCSQAGIVLPRSGSHLSMWPNTTNHLQTDCVVFLA